MVLDTQVKKATWTVDPTHSSVEFAVKHMVIATVRGRFAGYAIDADIDEAAPERSKVVARIEVASVETREAQRDGHLRSADFFDAEHYPQITFESRRIEPADEGQYRVVGDLTIRGVTREVVLDTAAALAKDPWGNQRIGFSAETTINRKDFGLVWNVGLETGGVLVGETVKINLEGELIKQS